MRDKTEQSEGGEASSHAGSGGDAAASDPLTLAFQAPPQPAELPRRPGRSDDKSAGKDTAGSSKGGDDASSSSDGDRSDADTSDGSSGGGSGRRRRGRRGGRGRGGKADAGETQAEGNASETAQSQRSEASGKQDAGESEQPSDQNDSGEGNAGSGSRRRRRRRRRGSGADSEGDPDDPPNTVVKVREPRNEDEDIQGVTGSTRIKARRQRRRDGRDGSRRRPPVVTESEFLARRESVERVMVAREAEDRTQIAVLEDGVLVEHYVSRGRAASSVGNVYLGRVQNVLPSMEAAFVDVGRGRNGVLYAGEVDYDAEGLEGKPHRIEQALKSGQSVPVQVTKDPIGHKGARLTGQISLPGRFMVFVPGGRTTGISRKLPDTERSRLKGILKKVAPDDAGVILRTAAEGASEEQLARDLARLRAQWEAIEKKSGAVSPPTALYTEPDLAIRVIRDVFNEDFTSLVVDGDDEWNNVEAYVDHVAPELAERASQWNEDGDVFAAYRIDEQLAKALERKVWLPSGGYLIIDRTEAMVVVDVNTGKFTGQGGNLEETVTKTNLEAAEEIVRQLRLRDLGGIIVVDFIDMVLEGNRDLVLRRLVEALGRDRTRHQVAEVTSLGLVQMTRKRVGDGLLEAFSETCSQCHGRGVVLTVDPTQPVEAKRRRHRTGTAEAVSS